MTMPKRERTQRLHDVIYLMLYGLSGLLHACNICICFATIARNVKGT